MACESASTGVIISGSASSLSELLSDGPLIGGVLGREPADEEGEEGPQATRTSVVLESCFVVAPIGVMLATWADALELRETSFFVRKNAVFAYIVNDLEVASCVLATLLHKEHQDILRALANEEMESRALTLLEAAVEAHAAEPALEEEGEPTPPSVALKCMIVLRGLVHHTTYLADVGVEMGTAGSMTSEHNTYHVTRVGFRALMFLYAGRLHAESMLSSRTLEVGVHIRLASITKLRITACDVMAQQAIVLGARLEETLDGARAGTFSDVEMEGNTLLVGAVGVLVGAPHLSTPLPGVSRGIVVRNTMIRSQGPYAVGVWSRGGETNALAPPSLHVVENQLRDLGAAVVAHRGRVVLEHNDIALEMSHEDERAFDVLLSKAGVSGLRAFHLRECREVVVRANEVFVGAPTDTNRVCTIDTSHQVLFSTNTMKGAQHAEHRVEFNGVIERLVLHDNLISMAVFMSASRDERLEVPVDLRGNRLQKLQCDRFTDGSIIGNVVGGSLRVTDARGFWQVSDNKAVAGILLWPDVIASQRVGVERTSRFTRARADAITSALEARFERVFASPEDARRALEIVRGRASHQEAPWCIQITNNQTMRLEVGRVGRAKPHLESSVLVVGNLWGPPSKTGTLIVNDYTNLVCAHNMSRTMHPPVGHTSSRILKPNFTP